MASVSGLGTTFTLPQYGGEIIKITPSETPFLSAIGGLNAGGEVVTSKDFEWQTQDLGSPAQPANLEGADPSLTERSRASVNNVVQIFQYAFGVSYTTMAAFGQMSGLNNAQNNPVTDELAYQSNLKLTEAARDINYTFINGVYAKPGDNLSARKTRGMLAAISTNVTDLDTDATAAVVPGPLTKLAVLDMVQSVWNSFGINQDAEPTLICNATLKRGLTKLFVTDANYREQSRNVGGVNVTQIETDFGRLNLMLERAMPSDQLAFVQLGYCMPVYLLVPGKGFLFIEELAKTGASEKRMLYGEVGLKYGAETAHGKIINAAGVTGA